MTTATTTALKQGNIDVETARKNASFSVDLLTTLLRGGPEALQKLNRLRAIVEREPLLHRSNTVFMSREEQLSHSIHAARRLIEIAEEHSLTDEEFGQLYVVAETMTPLSLNYGAFMPVIESQGTPEQVQKWLGAAKRHAIIGCYAQTELSHGSNVVGLQTTATFDEKTDEFIIHSPDLTAAKWWIGGLGVVSTHAVLQAQLIIAGKSYGPHIFIVPIRSPMDFQPIPGVTVGDIGPKAYGGFATTDNGYVLFDHVRIPRDNMLMKFAQVSRDGKYTPAIHSKISYGSMVKLRVGIVSDAGWRLAKAATIATRYCTVRRQFNADKASGLEAQVISYSSVQHRLYPAIATAYTLIVAGQELHSNFVSMTQQLARNDASMLPEMHVASCALKTWSSRRSSEGLEECRKAMGGHGFSAFSGVSDQFANFVPANTYEGDNYVLTQQVARALLKQLQNLISGKPLTLASAEYLKIVPSDNGQALEINDASDIQKPEMQLSLFGLRAARLVVDLAQQLQAGRPWSDLNMECWNVSFAHAEYLLVKQLQAKAQDIASSQRYSALSNVHDKLANLFCLSVITQSSLASFLATGTIVAAGVNPMQAQFRGALASVASDAINLTDAFGFTDRELNSALGRKDGNAYQALWEAVQRNPVNSPETRKYMAEIVKTILHRKDNLSFIKAAKL